MTYIHINTTTKPLTARKPKNWIDVGYRIKVPFTFKWRVKIGKTKCTCKECYEEYAPWYGVIWYHMEDCAILKLIEKRPQLGNLNQYYGHDFNVIAQTD